MKDEVAFRFSRKLGVVANNDLAGEPYYISVTDLKSPDVSATEEEMCIRDSSKASMSRTVFHTSSTASR